MSADEMEKYKAKDREEEAGACVMEEMRKDREDQPTKMELNYRKLLKDAAEASLLAWEKEHKLRQEAENELTIVKTNSVHQSPEMRDAGVKIKELEEGLANALAVNESHQVFNGKLQTRVTELEQDNLELHAKNIKLAREDEDKITKMRTSGM